MSEDTQAQSYERMQGDAPYPARPDGCLGLALVVLLLAIVAVLVLR